LFTRLEIPYIVARYKSQVESDLVLSYGSCLLKNRFVTNIDVEKIEPQYEEEQETILWKQDTGEWMTQIAIVGEAWGAEEERQRVPFVGAAGWQLTQMLNEAGINRSRLFPHKCFQLEAKSK
jgi:hypothetical protein